MTPPVQSPDTADLRWNRIRIIDNPMLRYGLIALALAYLVWSVGSLEINWNRIANGIPRAGNMFARMVPPLVLGPWVGAVADRIDRGRMLRYGLGIVILVSLVLALRTATEQIQLWELAIGVALGGAFWSLEHTVRRPLLGVSVGDSQIGRALSLDAATFNATRMLGPLVGGALFAVLGLTGVFVCSTLLYGLGLVALLASSISHRHQVVTSPESGQTSLERLRSLPAIVRADSRISAVLVVIRSPAKEVKSFAPVGL